MSLNSMYFYGLQELLHNVFGPTAVGGGAAWTTEEARPAWRPAHTQEPAPSAPAGWGWGVGGSCARAARLTPYPPQHSIVYIVIGHERSRNRSEHKLKLNSNSIVTRC